MATTWTATLWLDDIDTIDHADAGATNLLWQYQGLPRVEAFLGAILDVIDVLEGVAFDVLVGRSVYTAEGDQLDTLGRIVDQPRSELDDAEYRIFLVAKIYANRANGRLSELYHVLDMVGADDVKSTDLPPASARIEAADVTYPATTGRLLRLVKGGGVRLLFVYSREEAASTFQLSTTYQTTETGQSNGLGSSHTTTGGKISGAMK